jgi:hypothetical protein
MIKFNKGKVGVRAYTVSNVWKLGIHAFLNGEDLIFRVCYLRNRKGTHYVQISIQIRKQLDCHC